ncbi:MAG: S8 family peptidase [Candidatus Doudnabacteria bacterium]
MKKLILIFIFLCIATGAHAAERWIVVFDPAVVNEPARETLIKAHGGIIIKNLPLITGKAVLLPPQAEAALGKTNGVIRVDPDVVVEAYAKPTPPPPPPETLPWGVDQIDAELAWGTSTGSGVKVAVVDTGIDLSHPDLKVWGGINTINPRKGYNDDNGHGTHVAGTIAAINNEIGVIGVAPTASLYAVKVLNSQGSGFLSDIIEGLDWCINNEIQVVNMSLGTSSNVQSFQDAVKKVYDAGIIQVAAAGNSYGGAVGYPAAYSEVIAVSATDITKTIASFSSIGPEVELAAPGVSIPSTWKGGAYKTASGTSMAAPHVTGTVALAIANSVADVRATLQATADDLGNPGKDNLYGYGLVDAEEVVTGAQTHLAPSRISGLTPVGKIATIWGQLKKQ